jgi:hypothetical protein
MDLLMGWEFGGDLQVIPSFIFTFLPGRLLGYLFYVFINEKTRDCIASHSSPCSPSSLTH